MIGPLAVASLLAIFTPSSSHNSAINKDALMAFDAISCIMSQLVVNIIKLATNTTVSVLCRKKSVLLTHLTSSGVVLVVMFF